MERFYRLKERTKSSDQKIMNRTALEFLVVINLYFISSVHRTGSTSWLCCFFKQCQRDLDHNYLKNAKRVALATVTLMASCRKTSIT